MSSLPLTSRALAALAFGALTLTALPAWAESHDHDHEHAHDEAHEHDHGHAHDADSKRIYSGYFTDEEIQPRPLSDWHGDWQSVYPLLQDGTLAPVMAAKARKSPASFPPRSGTRNSSSKARFSTRSMAAICRSP